MLLARAHAETHTQMHIYTHTEKERGREGGREGDTHTSTHTIFSLKRDGEVLAKESMFHFNADTYLTIRLPHRIARCSHLYFSWFSLYVKMNKVSYTHSTAILLLILLVLSSHTKRPHFARLMCTFTSVTVVLRYGDSSSVLLKLNVLW